MAPSISGYTFTDAQPAHTHAYLWPALRAELDRQELPTPRKRVFDLGCGSGGTAKELSNSGWKVAGVDPSGEGIRLARNAYPDLDLRIGSSDDNLVDVHGRFPVVISLEVIEHVFSPRSFARCVFELLEPGGQR